MSPIKGLDPQQEESLKATLRVIAALLFMGLAFAIVGLAFIAALLFRSQLDLTMVLSFAGMMLGGFGALVGVNFRDTSGGEDD